jgi:hypothetical protein
LPPDIDPFQHIFRNTETGSTWSINELWHQLQEAADPFMGILKAEAPVFRTACFPYPGTVTLIEPGAIYPLGDVLLTIGLSIEAEEVPLAAATKMEYATPDNQGEIQRVEFASDRAKRRLSLQMPKRSSDISALRTGGSWPGVN